MKKSLRGIALFLVILMLSSFCLTSCEGMFETVDPSQPGGGAGNNPEQPEEPGGSTTVIYSLELRVSKTEVARGDTVTLSAYLKSKDKEEASDEAEFSIVEGADYATLAGNVLTIKNTANHGDVIKLKAHEGVTDSNTITVTVKVPATELTIAGGGYTNLLAGQSLVLTHTVSPVGADDNVKFVITEGADSAVISGNVLVVNQNAVTGKTIKVKATVGDVESNELSFTVGYPLTALVIACPLTNIISGSSAQLSVVQTPINATNGDYTWEFVEGSEHAVIVGNLLTVNQNAPTGATIKVRAISGDVESNTLSFTVGYPLESLTVSFAGATNLTSDKFVVLSVSKNPENATNGSYVWEYLEGGDYVTIVNNMLTLKPGAPTGATVKIRAAAGDIKSDVLEFTVGYPLKTIAVSSSLKNILSGSSITVGVLLNPENTTNGSYTWEFLAGGEYATGEGKVITVKSDAPTGAVIRARAVSGDIKSNILEFTVGYPLVSLNASLIGSANIENGNTAQLTVTKNPTNTTNGDYVWQFLEGEDFATLVGDYITVKNDAPVGSIIRLVAVSGSITSNEVSIMVGTPIESVQISTSAPEILERGESYEFIPDVTPDNASMNALSWFVEGGGEYVTINRSGILTVSKNTPAGTKITVYAASGSVKSNEFTFTVGIVLEKIEITLNGSQNVDPDGSRTISHTLTPSNASDTEVIWVIDEGAEYATLVNGVLTVKSNAPIGETVTFHAEIGEVKSEPITITVGIVLEKIEITLNGSQNVDPDGSRTISHTLTPSNASLKDVVWVIDEGAEYATLVNGILTVKSGATVGEKVTFHAEIGDVKSEPITITVGTPITNIEIEAIGSTGVVKGNTVGLSAVLTPENANPALLSWIITEGEEFAYIRGTTLVINSDADTGATVKVKAIFRDVESNEIEFTVMPTQEEINAQRYMIELSNNSLRVDKKGNTPTLAARIINGNYQEVTDLPLEFKVIEGAQYLALTQSGYNCTFVAIGHGEAKVEVRIAGTDVTETVSVDVVVPPESIVLPGPFAERPLFDYEFSKVDPLTGNAEKLPFVPTVRGDALACQDLVLSFIGEDGTTGDAVAVYENGEITFKKTGKVTVTISSASGSRLEASTSYTFNINEGYNANSFEELSFIIEYSSNGTPLYTGSLPINIVILDKPTAPDGSSYEYGYDMVPSFLLTGEEQTIAKMMRGYTTYTASNGQKANVNIRIQAVNKGLWLNGNNHKIDLSQLKIFTLAEYDAYVEEYDVKEEDYYVFISTLFSVETWTADGHESESAKELAGKSYYIKLYDLEVVGNAPIDYDPTKYDYKDGGKIFVGALGTGMMLGSYLYDTNYYIDSNNLTATKFHTGIHIKGIVGNGTISGMKVDNCYSTGIMVTASIVTLEDITIGKCGATGIELTPEESNKAGIGANENSTVTITGDVTADTNLNNGYTSYFNNYTIQDATVPYIITGNTAMYTNTQNSHIRNDKGEFIFVTLVFNIMTTMETNTSVLNYLAFDDEGGIIDISAIPKDEIDTTHRVISMDIFVDLPVYGTVKAAKAYFYNHNYGKVVTPDTAE